MDLLAPVTRWICGRSEMSEHMNEEQVKLWRKCLFSCFMGLLLIGSMIYLDRVLNTRLLNLMFVEIIKVGGWMFLWNGLQTLVYEIMPACSPKAKSNQEQRKNIASE